MASGRNATFLSPDPSPLNPVTYINFFNKVWAPDP